MGKITSLDVHSFNGEEYHDLKKYLLKHGCAWSEKRSDKGELLSVHLDFPQGTTVKESESLDERYKRHQVVFPDRGLMYWNLELASKKNRISVPYMYL